ncbi:hypothetical protein GCM10009554_74000 [Kribbella koreensis]|uniref:Pyrroloquinoline-quinone binding quinoprotein n=1 Tax=Kribbella koreensis TaxID=57909 RepID=A0ABN1RM17_9ACTN
MRALRPLTTAIVAAALLAGCSGGDDDKATDQPSSDGTSTSPTPSGPNLATFDPPKAFAPVSALAEGDEAGMPNQYYVEAGMVGETSLYALRTGLTARTLSANSWEVPAAADPTTKTTDLTPPMALQLNGKEVVAIAYKQVVQGSGTQKAHDQVAFQWIDPAEGDVLATVVADLSTLLGPGRGSSGLASPVYDPATGQIAVGLEAQYVENAPKLGDFTVFADPATLKATTIPGIRAAGVQNGVVVGVKGSQQEGAKDNTIIQADGVTGAVKKSVPVPAMNYLHPAGSGSKYAFLAGTGYLNGAKDSVDHVNSIYAVEIATGAVVENKLPLSADSADDVHCFSDHVTSVVCNRSLDDRKTSIAGFDDTTGKPVWGYDSSSNRVVPKITTMFNGLVYGTADDKAVLLDAKTGQDVEAPAATPTDGTPTPADTSTFDSGNVGGWGDTSLLYGNQQSPLMVSKYGSVYLQQPTNKVSPRVEKILVVQKAIG